MSPTLTSPSMGQFLSTLRTTSRLSRTHIAKRSACSEDYIKRIEKGERTPSPGVLHAIADSLDLSCAQKTLLFSLAYPDHQGNIHDLTTPISEDHKYIDSLPEDVLGGILNQYWDVEYSNATYRETFPGLESNVLQWFFNCPTSKDTMIDWHSEANLTVDWLKHLLATTNTTESELFDTLASSNDFMNFWKQPTVADHRPKDIIRVLDYDSGKLVHLNVKIFPTHTPGQLYFIATKKGVPHVG